MKKLVEFLATSLVDDKEAVHVEESIVDRKLNYALSVKPDDLGKVIGKKGRTVKAMRVLLSALASTQGRQVGLQVIEPELPAENTPEASEAVEATQQEPSASSHEEE